MRKFSLQSDKIISASSALISTLWQDQLCSECYSDGVLWLSLYRMVQWRCAVTVGVQNGTVTVCCNCRCTECYSDGVLWLSVYRMVQWRCAVTVGVENGRVTVCCDCRCTKWYSDGVLWLSVYKNWDRTLGNAAALPSDSLGRMYNKIC